MSIVTGGRSYKNWGTVSRVLGSLSITTLIQGGASGADELARKWADYNYIRCLTFEADWGTHGKAAGPIRNREMLTSYPKALVVAFPGGKGTEDCIRQAKELGMLVLRVDE